MRITITKRLRDQMLKLTGDDFWERLSDITEHPPEWLSAQVGGVSTAVRFELVPENEETMRAQAYGELR